MTRRLGVLLAAWLLLCCGSTQAASLDDGQHAYDLGAFAEARAIWLTLAGSGDPEAAYRLGTLYERGDGVAADAATAYCWYRQAAAGGVPAAAFNVAVMHDSGRGATADEAAAASWYGRAAALGLPRAEFNLGQLYEAGEGVPRNLDIAAGWYRRAAAAGLTAAADRLASLHPGAPEPATLPRPVSLDVPTGAAGAAVPLTWAAVPQTAPVIYDVEVVSTDGPTLRAVFSAATELSATLATLPPGRYAGRVFSETADATHYVIGGWTRFSVGLLPTRPACLPKP